MCVCAQQTFYRIKEKFKNKTEPQKAKTNRENKARNKTKLEKDLYTHTEKDQAPTIAF